MVKVSKQGKARIKRMTASERKALIKAAAMLADCECITPKRFDAIVRTARSAMVVC